MMKKLFLSSTSLLSAGAAFAGGYVAPVIPVPPPTVAVPAEPSAWWLAAIPLLFLLFKGHGDGDGINPLPPDYNGPCFLKGTFICVADDTWKPVEDIQAGDTVYTSKGYQTVIAVDSWRPTEYKDRPVVIDGVRVSPNHGIRVGWADSPVPAERVSGLRAAINGETYHHILVKDHAWLMARSGRDDRTLYAESLEINPDMKLGRQFPEIAAYHAQCSMRRVEVC